MDVVFPAFPLIEPGKPLGSCLGWPLIELLIAHRRTRCKAGLEVSDDFLNLGVLELYPLVLNEVVESKGPRANLTRIPDQLGEGAHGLLDS